MSFATPDPPPPADPSEIDESLVEEVVFDADGAFEAVKSERLHVDRIGVIGLDRTKLHIVARELVRVQAASTLEEVKELVLEAYRDLQSLDIFDAISITIDTSPKGAGHCDVSARFAEKSGVLVQSGSYVQGTEGSLEVSGSLTNRLGRAERLSASAEWGSQSTTLYSVGLTVPRPRGLPIVAELRVFQAFHSYAKWSSFTDLLRAGVLSAVTQDGRHALSYELGWHRIADPSRAASRAVQAQLGDKLKSALKYSRRESALVGTPYARSGRAWEGSLEVAGLGADPNLLRFAKPQGALRVALPVFGPISLTLSAEAGALLPWGSSGGNNATNITDRFFLGGLGGTPLRGFNQKGVGPTDARRPVASTEAGASPRSTRDSIGGDLFGTFLASLNFPLPDLTAGAGIYGHFFINGGSTVGLGAGGGASGSSAGLAAAKISELRDTFRWSAGAGIVWPTTIGRLELNYCRVLRAQEHDRAKHGLQFGFSPPTTNW